MSLLRLPLSIVVLALLFLTSDAIYHGSDADKINPYMASVFVQSFLVQQHACGGVIVGSRTVLTAAHCVDGVSLSSLDIRYGGLDREALPTRNPVIKVLIHPNWNTNTIDCDYAILTLQYSVAPPYATLSSEPISTNDDLRIYGWGGTSRLDVALPRNLRTAPFKGLSEAECNEKWSDINPITENMGCMQSENASFCPGDDGGPVFGDAGNNLVGIMSWGAFSVGLLASCETSTLERPNVFSAVAPQELWIAANTI